MVPSGFKISTPNDDYYFSSKNCNEKWSWLVSIERMMDFKMHGATFYNNLDWVKTKGFDSQIDFENGGKINPVLPTSSKEKNEEQLKR